MLITKNNSHLINVAITVLVMAVTLFMVMCCFAENGFSQERNIITDFEARRALANVLSYEDETLDEAIEEYRILIKEQPDEVSLRLELAQIRARQKNYQEALEEINIVLEQYPDRHETLGDKAIIEAHMGHIKKSAEIIMRLLQNGAYNEKLQLKLAEAMNIGGDFVKAETIYRNHLKKESFDNNVMQYLASTLTGMQRYEEAEEIYLKLLIDNRNLHKTFLQLAKLKLIEKDFSNALMYADKALEIRADDIKMLLFKAAVLYFDKKYYDALEIYKSIETKSMFEGKSPMECLIGAGKTYLKLNNLQFANEYFEKAYQYDQQNIEAQFYRTLPAKVVSDDFVENVFNRYRSMPDKLEEWAQLYKLSGFIETAIKFYEEILKFDNSYFPAKVALAEALAITRNYEPSITVLSELINDCTGNYKVLILMARVLSWSKHYEEAYSAYDVVINLNPDNPQPQKEKARVAVWDKQLHRASEIYTGIQPVAVDIKLFNNLKTLSDRKKSVFLIDNLQVLKREMDNGSVYQGYEEFRQNFITGKSRISDDASGEIEMIILNLHSDFRVQKSISLENQAKLLTWNKNFIEAMEVYEELIRFEPGNEEAIFDYGQIQCAIGLCDDTIETYDKLLNIDPIHSRALMAMDRENHKQNIKVEIDHLYWKELGRGELSDITRYRTDLGINIPVGGRNNISFTEHYWLEDPGLSSNSFSANGFTVGFDWIGNEYFSGSTKWTYKNYTDDELDHENTGHSSIWFNANDKAKIGIGYDRANEIYNFFGIDQGITSDAGWLSLSSNILRKLDVSAMAGYKSFSDNNENLSLSLSAGYEFTEFPKIFKVILRGDYFDAQKLNIFEFEEDELVNIVHPYWTPEDYKTGELTFKWYHNLSKLQFCGSEQHFYDLRVSPGMNTESTFSLKVEGGWHFEFLNHWKAGLKGSLFRSTEWDSETLRGSIEYQF